MQQTSSDLYSQTQRVEHAANLFHSEYLEHLRVKINKIIQ